MDTDMFGKNESHTSIPDFSLTVCYCYRTNPEVYVCNNKSLINDAPADADRIKVKIRSLALQQ